MQAKDEFNATVEGNFTVTLINVYEDPDGDGFSDSEELDAGTNPNDPNSKPSNEFRMLAKYLLDGNANDASNNFRDGNLSDGLEGTDRFEKMGVQSVFGCRSSKPDLPLLDLV